ncbi:hypothetical protein TSAR_004885 [Trichomalopsis sarcophagae]|uniref:ABC transmembrane type-1 domain-containing protein n=1 Tax=Trichomalopsis sarcophagae TaxID=543379 RepID=A0A232F4H4_9HYME|nr:hypothetical protein TSAR_004885 [Trichomalopsis sarcophagae]
MDDNKRFWKPNPKLKAGFISEVGKRPVFAWEKVQLSGKRPLRALIGADFMVLYPFSMTSATQAYLYVTAAACLLLIEAFTLCHTFYHVLLGMKMKIACTSLVHRKMLRLSCLSAGGDTAGRIMNLMSSDVAYFDMIAIYMPYLLITPMELLITSYLLWRYIGYAVFIGVPLMILQIFQPKI